MTSTEIAHDDSGWRKLLTHPQVYDAVQWTLGGPDAMSRYVREVIRPEPGARILDIGCGPGSIVGFLPKTVRYTGYDMNADYVLAARRRFRGQAEFFQGRVGATSPLPDAGSFDLVTANSLLHHLDDDDVHALMEAARVHLRPGGTFVTLDPVRVGGASPIARLLVGMDRGHRVRSAEGYRALLASAFDVIEDRVLDDLLRVPYTHYAARCTR